VGLWEAGLAAGEGKHNLKRRLGSPEARNTDLDEECDSLSTRRNEQDAMFAEWELSHDQRRVDCKEEDDRVRASRAADKERWLAESRDQGVRSHDQEARYLELWKRSYEEAELHVEFAQVCKEYQRADAAHIATLKMALGTFAGKAGVLKADPVAKKQKIKPRKVKGDWGGWGTPRSCI
jgi:hypothetical protein